MGGTVKRKEWTSKVVKKPIDGREYRAEEINR
jgi:hypothetical protein